MWKTIPDYSDYDINTDGVVRSWKTGKPVVLKQHLARGYNFVVLRNGNRRQFYVHRLVWLTFNGEIPDGMYVLHGEGADRQDNRLSNLHLGTKKDNSDDRDKDGNTAKGSSHGCSVLTEDQVKYIKARLADGMKMISIANLFGVTLSAINHIKRGSSWSHI